MSERTQMLSFDDDDDGEEEGGHRVVMDTIVSSASR